eukprot:14024866-Heterocapsa_arctica.AAC.1
MSSPLRKSIRGSATRCFPPSRASLRLTCLATFRSSPWKALKPCTLDSLGLNPPSNEGEAMRLAAPPESSASTLACTLNSLSSSPHKKVPMSGPSRALGAHP